MLTLTSILTFITGAAHYAWALLLLLVPQVLNILTPAFQAITECFSSYVSFLWQAVKKNDSSAWLLAITIAAIAFAVGYHYGWHACLDWGHENYRWIAKRVISQPWWKFW